MEINEAIKLKRKLEADIRKFIRVEIAEFQNATGLNVQDLRLDFVEITTFIDTNEKYELANVKAKVKL